MLVPFRGAPTWWLLSTRNICHSGFPLKCNISTLELWHIEINTSEQELLSQAKVEQQLIFWPIWEPHQVILMSRNVQSWKFKHAPLHNENPVRLKQLQNIKLLGCLTYDETKFQRMDKFLFWLNSSTTDKLRH